MNKRVMLNGKLSSLLAVALVLLAFAFWRPSTAQAQWSTPDSNGNINSTNTGNIGIGTSSPTRQLTLSNLTKPNLPWPVMGFNISNGGTDMKNWVIWAGQDWAGNNGFFFQTVNDAENNGQSWMQVYRSGINITNVSFPSGNVGIGLTSPAQKLDVGGNLSIFGATVINSNRVFSARSSFNTYTADGVWNAQATPSTIFTPSASINTGFFFGYEDEGTGQYTPSLGISVPQTPTTNARVLQLRQFGGTSPEAYNRFEMNVQGKLSWGSGASAVDTSITRSAPGTLTLSGGFNVTGQISTTGGICIGGICKNSWSEIGGGSQWSGTGNIYYNTGNVGIGTTDPAEKLDVRGNLLLENGGNPALYTGTAGAELNRYLNLLNSTSYASASGLKAGGILISDTYAYANPGKNDLVVKGSVSVGKASPDSNYKLDVAGNIQATGDLNATGTITGGNIQAKYQDVAEWVPSRQKLAAGTVVILDPEKTNQVIASTEAYDTRVAGVISDSPGVILGEGGEGKVKVATTGRVRVKVDATRGAIKIGDLLVTSDEEGVAMKSEPINIGGRMIHSPGTIIGKALEPLERGKGEILVLLSLQ